ncbi:hypothetical protein BDV32DRAFT_159202 [Aspergillus pseudonomiae]|uniref:Uncharacterized protein n=1 Tax=Aspergillus pseudonomiae TaxID=1506151 RepID=A0A5N6HZ34_9EURO|nr:uncharacterized protein BDV37DRAFT_260340 [Aspergillus pseudonomiae]KAB8259646.1 hypothetical protein BDV32DRAFT_159202 [Aspergillus pseudonomiae]KAE8399460.1 hypothetical protein BDV37DRAFT_260340 [Aspergillus pseudonomiae]
MNTRQTRRKRSISSISNSEPRTSTSCRSPRVSGGTAPVPSCETPRQQTKRVRFSDPGPRLEGHCPGCSTGLTPALIRTSFEEPDDPTNGIDCTPSRRLRRRSTPLAQSRRSLESVLPIDGSKSKTVVQFTPLRQILDSRTQRRIRRLGLSTEINQFEREKRESAHYQKSLRALLQERDTLKQELELAKGNSGTPEYHSPRKEILQLSPRSKLEHLESQNSQLRQDTSFSAIKNADDQSDGADTEGDTIILDNGFEGDTVLMSDSPIMRGLQLSRQSPDDLSCLSLPDPRTDASVQTSLSGNDQSAEFLALSLDLEAARKEKRDLFNAWRTRLASFSETATEPCLQRSSPPPDFFDQILPTLTGALTSASDAIGALDAVKQELSGLGFPGSSMDEIISEMRSRFRSARLQLERAVPGETPSSSLDNGNTTLSALVRRVELLVKSLSDERTRHEGSLGRERALRGQFDNLLIRYETASTKISDLEESIASSAGDMLHTRMRMQELEREGKEQALGIERLNEALSKYRVEVKTLENLVTELEQDKAVSATRHEEQMLRQEKRVAEEKSARRVAESAIAEREARIQELEGSVESNKIRVCDLAAKIEALEKELKQTVDSHEQQAVEQLQHHQQEVGRMNVRIAELTTYLDATKSEADKLRRSNAGLEEQLRLEVEARDDLLEKWAADQARSYAYMKETVKAERRKAKVRTANWELKSDELQSDGTNIGSEPITPVSVARFVDVEVGRGKERRRLDSGIGILTSDELFESVGIDNNPLPSDPADL